MTDSASRMAQAGGTIVVTVVAVVLLVVMPASAAPRPPKPPAQPAALLVEVRRDVWQDPELRTMDEAGTGITTPISGVKRGGQARWSPDGTRIGGYHRQFGDGSSYLDRAIMSAKADGSDERIVVSGRDLDAFNVAAGHKSLVGGPNMMPISAGAWGPDGGAMALSAVVRDEGATVSPDDDTFRQRIFTVTHTGRQVAGVTAGSDPFNDTEPHWSAAVNKIVFVRSPAWPTTGPQELWVVNPDGTGLQQLTDFGASRPSAGFGNHIAAPAWSPDGTRIALVGNLNANNVVPSGDVWLLDISVASDGAVSVDRQSVLRGETQASEWHPAWSPDGTRVVYMRLTPANDRQTRYQLVIGSVATGNNTVIAENTKQAILYPHWRRT